MESVTKGLGPEASSLECFAPNMPEYRPPKFGLCEKETMNAIRLFDFAFHVYMNIQ